VRDRERERERDRERERVWVQQAKDWSNLQRHNSDGAPLDDGGVGRRDERQAVPALREDRVWQCVAAERDEAEVDEQATVAVLRKGQQEHQLASYHWVMVATG
jgi:hypothetical protein